MVLVCNLEQCLHNIDDAMLMCHRGPSVGADLCGSRQLRCDDAVCMYSSSVSCTALVYLSGDVNTVCYYCFCIRVET